MPFVCFRERERNEAWKVTSTHNVASIRGRKLVVKMTTFAWNSWRGGDRRAVLMRVCSEETEDGAVKRRSAPRRKLIIPL